MRLLLFFCFLFSLAAGEKSIGIFTFKVNGVSPWDPESVKKGITGSEEAVIYLSEKLADLGYRVVVLANPPKGSPHSSPEANPRYIDLEEDDGKNYEIVIGWRMPGAAPLLKKRGGRVYLWPHDILYTAIPEAAVQAFDGVFWLSEWQRQQYISLSPSFARFTTIYGNGVNPDLFSPVQEKKNPYACIYGSNYARGLEILLDIWPMIKHLFPRATLDIYYGWQHWGNLNPEKEGKMRQRVAALAKLGVSDHGLVGHQELIRAYEAASFWTYPCIHPETFCITALKAQLGGAIPVILQGSALKETVRHGYPCKAQEHYLLTLIRAMENVENISLDQRREMGEFVKREYTWEAIAQKWVQSFTLPK